MKPKVCIIPHITEQVKNKIGMFFVISKNKLIKKQLHILVSHATHLSLIVILLIKFLFVKNQ